MLLSRTAMGLQRLLDAFGSYMKSLDLIVNIAKSHIMTMGQRKRKSKTFLCSDAEVSTVSSFTYLGVLFDERSSWAPQFRAKKNAVIRSTSALLGFTQRLGARPFEAILSIYRSKCLAIAMYGSAIWGYKQLDGVQLAENRFLRTLLCVPQSTPTFAIHQELGLGYVTDLLRVAPLVCWLKTWLNPDITLNHQILRDCVPWIGQAVFNGCPM